MSVGQMNQRISFKENKTIIDPETRLPSEEWVEFYSCWAKVDALEGREYFQAAAAHSENTLKFTIRYKEGLKESMALFWQGRKFDIKAILPNYVRKDKITVMCEEVK